MKKKGRFGICGRAKNSSTTIEHGCCNDLICYSHSQTTFLCEKCSVQSLEAKDNKFGSKLFQYNKIAFITHIKLLLSTMLNVYCNQCMM